MSGVSAVSLIPLSLRRTGCTVGCQAGIRVFEIRSDSYFTSDDCGDCHAAGSLAAEQDRTLGIGFWHPLFLPGAGHDSRRHSYGALVARCGSRLGQPPRLGVDPNRAAVVTIRVALQRGVTQ